MDLQQQGASWLPRGHESKGASGSGGQVTGPSLEDGCPFCAPNKNKISSQAEKVTPGPESLLTCLPGPDPPVTLSGGSALGPQEVDSRQSEK